MEGKCGLITGGGSGMGRASAIRFSEEGAKVLVAGRTVEKLQETLRLVREKGGVAEYFQCDVTKEDQVKAMVSKTVELFGKLDFACNNASIESPGMPIWERDTESFMKVIETDMVSVFYCLKYEGAVMVRQGNGSIVNISSGAGAVGVGNMEPYACAKAGVNSLTQSSAIGMGPYGVRVNAVLPGLTLTPMIKDFSEHFPKLADQMKKAIPLGRLAQPEEQANAAMFLCSDLSSDITGVLLKVDGGYQAGYYTKED